MITEASHTDRPVVGINPSHVQPWCQAEHFREARRTRAADVLVRDDVDRGWNAPRLVRLFGRGRHLNVAEVHEAQLLQRLTGRRSNLSAIRCVRDGRGRQQGECQHKIDEGIQARKDCGTNSKDWRNCRVFRGRAHHI